MLAPYTAWVRAQAAYSVAATYSAYSVSQSMIAENTKTLAVAAQEAASAAHLLQVAYTKQAMDDLDVAAKTASDAELAWAKAQAPPTPMQWA